MFTCDACGKIDHVLVDGYPVSDLLEGVLFKVVIDTETGEITATAPDGDYMEQLNVEQFEQEVARYASQLDIAECPKCHADVDMVVPV